MNNIDVNLKLGMDKQIYMPYTRFHGDMSAHIAICSACIPGGLDHVTSRKCRPQP